jgi:PadR family transcriptional regulator, regulatory protein PadR
MPVNLPSQTSGSAIVKTLEKSTLPGGPGMHSDLGDPMNIQFKKGVIEICVLSVLAHKDCYGYELVGEISKRIDISEGTIYPLLRRLKDEGFVTTYLQESVEGPPRKYYRLTESGRKEEHEQKDEWMRFAASVNALLERKNDA